MKTRTENIAKNAVFSTIAQVISFFIGFISRTIFIKLLGAEYLGINSLFTNILTILSFAEMGIGTAIIYNMYKPLATNDKKKLNQLVYFYKKTYFIIGIIILVIGLALIPLLDFFVTEMPNIQENIIVIYLMFIINTTISYFYAYRTTIISADQKNYIVVVSAKVFHIIQVVLQIVLLLLTKNYYLYLIIQIICTFANNIYLSIKSKKMYPFLKKYNNYPLSKKEKTNIFSNVKTLFIYKLASIFMNGTDSIIISKYLGIIVVGLYSNYALIISAVTEVLGIITQSMTASIGNLNSVATEEAKERSLYSILYFTFVIYGICSVLLINLLNNFINLWLGQEFLISIWTIITIIGHFYVNGMQYASYSYRNTLGLFKEGVIAPALALILNIILSIILAKIIGLPGVFLATIISRFFTYGIIDPIIVFKNEFKKSTKTYYKKYFLYIFVVIITTFIVFQITNFISVTNFILLIFKAFVTLVITIFLFYILTFKTNEYKTLKNSILLILKKFRKSE